MKPKTIIITGSASGIGLHLTDVFIRHGHRVMATARNLQKLEAAAKERNWPKDTVMLRKLEISDRAAWAEIVGETVMRFGSLDLLINNAGVMKSAWVHELKEEDVHNQIDTNLKGTIFGTQEAARQMVRQRRGHIINIASLAGVGPVPGVAVYCASKYGIRGFSLSVAAELREYGVNLTVICPDAVETPMLVKEENSDPAAIAFSNSHPLTTQDIERAVFRAINKPRRLQILLPFSRGFVIRLADIFPQIALPFMNAFRSLGKRHQEKRRLKA